MDIEFCDLCNESVPVPDFALGRAFRRKGRVVCARCDAAMGNREGKPPDRPGGFDARPSVAQSGAALGASTLASGPAPASAPGASDGAQRWVAAGPLPTQAEGVRSGSSRRSKGGILGAFLGSTALAAVAGGGVLVAERLDALERRSAAVQEQVQLQVDRLRRERASALAPFGAGIARVEDALRKESESIRASGDARIAELEARLREAAAREAGLLTNIEGLRNRVEGVRADALEAADRTRDLLTKVDNVVEFHGNRIIQLEERIREAGALVAAGMVPQGAGQPAARPASWESHLPDLRNADAALRLDAVSHLAQTKDPAVVPHILPLSNDTDLFVRMVVAQALGDLGAKVATPALIERLEDESVTVREAAVIALRQITQQNFGYEPDARELDRRKKIELWRTWWRKSGDAFLAS